MARFCAALKRLVDGKGPAGQADELRRGDRLGAAAHPAQALLDMQGRDVAPDRRLGRVRQVDHLLHRHDRLFLDGGQDERGGALFRAWFLPCTVHLRIQTQAVSIISDQDILIVQCNMIDFDRL